MSREKHPSFSVGKVLFGALVLPWKLRRSLARVLAAPTLALLCMWYFYQFAPLEDLPQVAYWALAALQGLLLAWLAVPCHRQVLGFHAEDAYAAPRVWTGAEWKYLLWMAAVAALALVTGFAAGALAGGLFSSVLGFVASNLFDYADFHQHWLVAFLTSILPLVGFAYMTGRFALALPAVALGQPASLRKAWRQSQDNGWRMAMVVGLLPYLLKTLLNALFTISAAPLLWALAAPLQVVIAIVQVMALSLAYRELVVKRTPVSQG